MARNGSGTYNLPSGNPVVTGTTISSTTQNNTLSDIATALTQSLAKDGQTTPTANLPMGGFKLTGLASGSARTDSASIANLQDGTGIYVATVGGTSDVITLTSSPAISSYTAGQWFAFISSGANTTNVTVNVSGLGAKAITKNGATALVAGDIPAAALVSIVYDGTQFQLQTSANLNALSSITGLGTGVAAALAINVGSAGAPVVNGGAGSFIAASQAEQETGSSTTVGVTPGRQQFHPSACKGWVRAGVSANILESYNVALLTDASTGVVWVSWDTDFSSANHVCVATLDTSTNLFANTNVLAAAIDVIESRNSGSGALTDPTSYSVVAFGDQ